MKVRREGSKACGSEDAKQILLWEAEERQGYTTQHLTVFAKIWTKRQKK